MELLTGGVMQVGWADQFFKGDSENGDGVGDDQHSWAYDGCRQQKWNGEAPEDYGAAWSAGDVVGCLLDLESVNDKEGVDAEDRLFYVCVGCGGCLPHAATCTVVMVVYVASGHLAE